MEGARAFRRNGGKVERERESQKIHKRKSEEREEVCVCCVREWMKERVDEEKGG